MSRAELGLPTRFLTASSWLSGGGALGPLGAVLEAVRLGHGRSRAEVAAHTGLSRGVVSQRLSELIECGLLEDGEPAESTGGRPARRLHLRSDAGTLLVADVGATSIDVALTDMDGRILETRQEEADVAEGPEVVLSRIEERFDDLLRSSPLADAEAVPWGVGIGLPGPVEFASGRPVSPPIMPGWNGYPVRERLVDRFGVPVWVDNDVNIMALGESRAGVGRYHANMVFVKIGTGIGAGVIAEGVLHRGARGSAGDVGHIQVTDDRSIICRCGNIGCLEALAGGHALGREASAAATEGRSAYLAEVLAANGTVTACDLSDGAARGDIICAELIQRSGHLVGTMLAGVVNFFNPSLIVIGGGVASAGDQLLAAVREAVYRRSLPLSTRDLRIVTSDLGAQGGQIGAATMVADELFSPAHLARTLSRHTQVPRARETRLLAFGAQGA